MVQLKENLNKLKEVALIGNPNSGKTTVFNALTGLRHSIANYPGVTVEKKLGVLKLPKSGEKVSVLDLPGTYSLLPRSLDEQVVHDVLLGIQRGTPAPDLVVVILDSANLERNLYLALQIIESGQPVVLALNMWDIAEARGISIDIPKLEALLGVSCLRLIGSKRNGVNGLKQRIEEELSKPADQKKESSLKLELPEAIEAIVAQVSTCIKKRVLRGGRAVRGEAIRLLGDDYLQNPFMEIHKKDYHLLGAVNDGRRILAEANIDWPSFEAESRYEKIESICGEVISKNSTKGRFSVGEVIDKALTHKFWGLVFFAALMGMIFQSVFSWANAPMDWIEGFVGWLGRSAGRILPDGQLQSLIVDGVIAGVGNVVIFLPQIFLLFFFIALLEDIGYMARAAFVLDRLMKKVGLNGKAFLPLLSCFACAVPGIMSTRTIEDKNDRLATILVAPLMSCSARLPVYTLMIGAFIPAIPVLGFFNLKAAMLFSMYALSIIAGLLIAGLFKKTFLKGEKTPFLLELPPYRLPNFKTILIAVWDRGKEFLSRAGTIIFCISIILWFLISYPKAPEIEGRFQAERQQAAQSLSSEDLQIRMQEIDHEQSGEELRHSFAGRLGHLIEPVIEPLGFDWKIGIGLVASFAAREVLVSTLAIVNNVGGDADETSVDLITSLQNEVSEETGKPIYTPLVAVALMVFFVFACQCMSTLAIVKRETNTWRWPIFMFTYMALLAWAGSFVVYNGGKLLGFE